MKSSGSGFNAGGLPCPTNCNFRGMTGPKDVRRGRKEKQDSAEFKAGVAMASLSGEKSLAELLAEFGVHPTMIRSW